MSDRKAALDQLTRLTQDLGLYDDEDALVTALRERDEARAECDRLREALEQVRNTLLARSYQGQYASDNTILTTVEKALARED